MYESTIEELARKLATADRKEAARISMRIKELKKLASEQTPT